MKSVAAIFRYRRSIIPNELRKGLYVISNRTGWPVYQRDCEFSHGGYVPREIGARYLPKQNTTEP